MPDRESYLNLRPCVIKFSIHSVSQLCWSACLFAYLFVLFVCFFVVFVCSMYIVCTAESSLIGLTMKSGGYICSHFVRLYVRFDVFSVMLCLLISVSSLVMIC